MIFSRFKIRKVTGSLICALIFQLGCNLALAQEAEVPSEQHSILQLNSPAEVKSTPTVEPANPADPAATKSPSAVDSNDEILSEDSLNNINQLVTRLVLEAIPHTYSKDKDWGGQEKRWNGIRLRRDDGGRLETKRKWKMVNHGTWKKYSATLVDPENKFSIEVQNLRRTEGEKLGFDVLFAADLNFNARQAKWAKGVQLYSVTAEGHGRLQLRVDCEMDVKLDLDDFPPDLIFEPVVKSAEITVEEFHIDRVSKLGGEFAQQITRAARKILDEKIAEKEADLVEKLNNEIEEEGELRLDIGDSSENEWAKEAIQFLPGSVQEAFPSENEDSSENED